MSDDDAPDWDALPRDPERFFRLTAGEYDRGELKRCYARLIKRYKPERDPDRFQQIRQAYEDLESRLRYGRPLSAPIPRARPETEVEPSLEETPPIDSWAERDPVELYEELRRRPRRTVSEHYTLAVLSDVVQPSVGGLAFLRHLAEGLAEHPGNLALTALLHRALSVVSAREVSPEAIERIVRMLAPVLPAPQYYFLTEPLWLALLRSHSFESFAACLSDCEAEFGPEIESARVVFRLRVATAACFRASDSWLAMMTEAIFEHGLRIGAAFDEDLDFFDLLLQYRRERENFLGAKRAPLRERIDRTIREWCEQPEQAGQAGFLDAQIEVTEAADSRLLDAFPYRDRTATPALFVLYAIAAQMEGLAGVDRATPTGSVPRRQVREFANRVERITNSSTYGLNWRLWGVLYLLGLAAGLALPPFLIAAVIPVPTPIAVGIFTLSGAAWAFLFWTKLKPRWIEPLRLRTAYAIARRCYRGVWRRELLQLVRSSHLPLRVIENELEAIEDENITNDDWIAMLMREDPALTLLEMAQGFLH